MTVTESVAASNAAPAPRRRAPHAEFMQIWEEGYVSNHISFENMHTPSAFIVEGAPLRGADGRIDRAKILGYVEATMASNPVFRLRLQRSFLGLTAPAWIPDQHFDLARHVLFADEVADRATADVRRLAGDDDGVMSIRHPLWRLRVTELSDGDVAIGVVMHHASVDGTTGMKLMSSMNQKNRDDAVPAPSDPFADRRAPRAIELPFLALSQWWAALPEKTITAAWRSYWAKPILRRLRRVAARITLPLRYHAGGARARAAALPPRHSASRQLDAAEAGRRAREMGGTLSDLLLAATISAWNGEDRLVKLRFPVSFHATSSATARNNVRDMEVSADANAPLVDIVASVHAQVADRDTAWDGRVVPGRLIGYTTLLPWVSRTRYFCAAQVLSVIPFPASLGTDALAAAGIMYNGSLFIGANMPVDEDVEATVGRIYERMTGRPDPGRQ